MTDLDREFRSLDRLSGPNLADEIDRRVREEGPLGTLVGIPDSGRSGGRRVVAGLVAILVFATAGLFTWRAFSPTKRPEPAVTPSAVADPWADLASGWTELPPPPEFRGGAALVWTGSEVLYWGGYAEDDDYSRAADGFAFEPSTMAWRPIPSAPAARSGMHGVWTGTEAIFWGGDDGEQERVDGLAYNPALDTWRVIPSAPLEAGWGGVVVWTGTEMIVWGGGRPGDARNRSGAAYDPSTDTWRTIAQAPLGLNLASGVWTGREMIVFGSLLDNRNIADADTSVGAAYDPLSDSWRTIPPSALSPQATSAVWVGDRMIAWDYEVHAQEYFPDEDRWSESMKMPLDFGECYPDSVATEEVLFAWFCGQVVEYDIATGEWREVHGGVTEPEVEANESSYKLFRFATLVVAGDAVVLEAVGITVDEDGTPCYGCPGAPVSFWVYRQPAS